MKFRIKQYWIGNQKILREEKKDNIIRVTLEADQKLFSGIGETETVEYHPEIYKLLKTDTLNKDVTKLRYDRCRKVIEEIVLVLLQNCTQVNDIQHIFQSVLLTLENAQKKKDRRERGITEDNWNVYQLKDELLRSK